MRILQAVKGIDIGTSVIFHVYVKDATTGIIAYTVDGVEKSHICIDVSSFQKEINWDKVKASGVEYALIRCGFRGYGTGKY